MSDIYLALSGINIEPSEVRVSDRTSDLGIAVVNFGDAAVHVNTAAAARVISEAFARAAEFHDARKAAADRDAGRIRELESRVRDLEGNAPGTEAQGGEPS